MTSDSFPKHPTQAVRRSWLARSLPGVTLVLLSPLIVDVLPGTTRLSTLVGLISEIATYGCAALLIRWLVRSRGLSNAALLLLGIAYALLEECVFLQTSLTPPFGAPAGLINAGEQTPASHSADDLRRRSLLAMKNTLFFQLSRAQELAQRACQAVSRGSEAALIPPGKSAMLPTLLMLN